MDGNKAILTNKQDQNHCSPQMRIDQQHTRDLQFQSINLEQKSSSRGWTTKSSKQEQFLYEAKRKIQITNNKNTDQKLRNRYSKQILDKQPKFRAEENRKIYPEIISEERHQKQAKVNLKLGLQKLANHNLMYSVQNMIDQDKIQTLKLKQAFINDAIINVIEESKAHHSKLAHVIVPFGLILLELFSLNRRKGTYVHKKFLQILKLLNNKDIQDQIDFKLFQSLYLFFIQYRNKTQQQVTQMLYNFLTIQRKTMQAVCPFYLNMFIMIVNKDVIFKDRNSRLHINYTIKFDHRRYDGQFGVEDVMREVEKLEEALAYAYNSTQI